MQKKLQLQKDSGRTESNLGAGYWVLGAGCWVLGAWCLVLGAGCWDGQ